MPGKLKWLASDIEAFIASQSNKDQPVNVTTAKHRKKQEQEYRERQQRAEQTLQRHKLNRKAKGKNGNK
jgi:hypothetical protein